MDERASDERDRFQIGGAESLLVDYDQALDISPALHDAACTRLRVACGSVVASRVKLKEIPKSDSLSSSASTSRVLRLSRRGRSFVSIGTFEPNICTDDILEAGFSKKERDHGCWGYIPASGKLDLDCDQLQAHVVAASAYGSRNRWQSHIRRLLTG